MLFQFLEFMYTTPLHIKLKLNWLHGTIIAKSIPSKMSQTLQKFLGYKVETLKCALVVLSLLHTLPLFPFYLHRYSLFLSPSLHLPSCLSLLLPLLVLKYLANWRVQQEMRNTSPSREIKKTDIHVQRALTLTALTHSHARGCSLI